MCGATLSEDQPEQEEEKKERIPSWVGSVAVVVLALGILAGGGFGLYQMLAVEPEPTPLTPTLTPSPTLTPVPSATPTSTPVPTATPTPIPPQAHDVQDGETLSDIAEQYGVTVDRILALNTGVDPQLIRPGDVLLIPAPTPAGDFGGSTSGDFVIHIVSSGETLSAIALEYGVSVSMIRAANDLSSDDETIRPEQSLVIPLSTPTPTATPTANPMATPTAMPPYAPPPLLYPPDGALLTDGGSVLLQWASVSVLKSDEWYEVSLWQPAGGAISSTVRTRATSWRVPIDLLQGGDGDPPDFEWRVQVVREAEEDVYEEAGAASEAASFVWRGPTPTQLPSATATP